MLAQRWIKCSLRWGIMKKKIQVSFLKFFPRLREEKEKREILAAAAENIRIQNEIDACRSKVWNFSPYYRPSTSPSASPQQQHMYSPVSQQPLPATPPPLQQYSPTVSPLAAALSPQHTAALSLFYSFCISAA